MLNSDTVRSLVSFESDDGGEVPCARGDLSAAYRILSGIANVAGCRLARVAALGSE
jgi:hypothetical protein